jgi:hypothetical protein
MRTLITGYAVAGMLILAGGLTRAEDPQTILDKAIKATGGEEKLAKPKAVTWKGKGTFYGLGQPLEFTGEWFIQPPDKMKSQSEFEFGGVKALRTTIFHGDKGWIRMGETLEDMNEDQVVEAKADMYAGRVATLVPLKSKDFTLAPLGEEKVNGQDAVGIKVSSKGHGDINLYFDKSSGLLVKSQRRIKDMDGQETDQETLNSDFKDVDGIKHAAKITINRDGKKYVELEVSEYKFVDKLDDSLFAKPGQ